MCTTHSNPKMQPQVSGKWSEAGGFLQWKQALWKLINKCKNVLGMTLQRIVCMLIGQQPITKLWTKKDAGVLQASRLCCHLAIKSDFDFWTSASWVLFSKTEKTFLHNRWIAENLHSCITSGDMRKLPYIHYRTMLMSIIYFHSTFWGKTFINQWHIKLIKWQ